MTTVDGLVLRVGGRSRSDLVAQLRSSGVLLNEHAETLLATEAFDEQPVMDVVLAERSVSDLGRPDGATLPEVLVAAEERGLALCPLGTGPALRLRLGDQAASTAPAMSTGSAPQGALTVASEPLRDDPEFPKGFYLRVVDGQVWLRGYRCDDEHRWSPDDRFVFMLPGR